MQCLDILICSPFFPQVSAVADSKEEAEDQEEAGDYDEGEAGGILDHITAFFHICR